MQFRTDLAVERREVLEGAQDGIEEENMQRGQARVTRIRVLDERGAQAIGKPVGVYVTIEVPPFSQDAGTDDELTQTVGDELRALLPEQGLVLVIGLGNPDITPDALGPKVADRTLATRHIAGEIARSAGLGALREVAVLAPGVLGQTGVETGEIVQGLVGRLRPAAVVAIDALASRRLARLGCTVQLADTGISPGAGVGNMRKEISAGTLGVPVIAVGVPTVVDAATLAQDLAGESGQHFDPELVAPRGAGMMVTPQEIDLLITRAARMIADAINAAAQPHLELDLLRQLV